METTSVGQYPMGMLDRSWCTDCWRVRKLGKEYENWQEQTSTGQSLLITCPVPYVNNSFNSNSNSLRFCSERLHNSSALFNCVLPLLPTSLATLGARRKKPWGSTCPFPRCKYSYHGWFPATNGLSKNSWTFSNGLWPATWAGSDAPTACLNSPSLTVFQVCRPSSGSFEESGLKTCAFAVPSA